MEQRLITLIEENRASDKLLAEQCEDIRRAVQYVLKYFRLYCKAQTWLSKKEYEAQDACQVMVIPHIYNLRNMKELCDALRYYGLSFREILERVENNTGNIKP